MRDHRPMTRREKAEAARALAREQATRARVERASVDIARAFNGRRARSEGRTTPVDQLPDVYDGRFD